MQHAVASCWQLPVHLHAAWSTFPMHVVVHAGIGLTKISPCMWKMPLWYGVWWHAMSDMHG